MLQPRRHASFLNLKHKGVFVEYFISNFTFAPWALQVVKRNEKHSRIFVLLESQRLIKVKMFISFKCTLSLMTLPQIVKKEDSLWKLLKRLYANLQQTYFMLQQLRMINSKYIDLKIYSNRNLSTEWRWLDTWTKSYVSSNYDCTFEGYGRGQT